MKPIESALAELRRAILLSKLFNSLIDLLLVFLASYLATVLMNIAWYYAFVPTVFYWIFFLRKRIASLKYQEVEQRVPILREKLRTAADNVHKDNTIVRQLHQEVLAEMKLIKTSMFLQPFTNTVKMGAIGILAFSIVLMGALGVELFDFHTLLEDLQGKFGDEGVFIKDLNITFQEGDEDIYGEESIVDYGNEELDLGLDTAEGNLDFSKEREAQQLNFYGQYPTEEDLKALSDSAYVEKKLAKDDEEIVKRYFNQITQ
ncbi:MAG: hypothetical protein AABX86_02445 [Nanoarchaeota archaeon]